MTPQEFNEVIKKLIALGEDAEELELWQKLYPDLEAEEQEELAKNVVNELKQLEKLA